MAHEILHGYAIAAFESAAAAGRLASTSKDLEVFAKALTDSEPLRRTLTDPLIPEGARRGVVSDVLRGRADPEAAALVDFALRVVRPSELAVAIADIDNLAEEMLAVVEETPTSGRSAVRDRLRGYVERVLEEVPELAEIDEIEDELFRFSRILDSSPSLRHVIADVLAPSAGRCEVLTDLLGGKVRPATLRLVTYVVRAGVVRDLVGTYSWLVELAAEERGRRIAEVRAAVALSDQESARLAAALSELVHRDVEVRVIEDPSVIGGVLISVGDLLIDGTVRLRFERLRDAIAQWA